MTQVTTEIKNRYQKYVNGSATYKHPTIVDENYVALKYPPYLCQPYERPKPKQIKGQKIPVHENQEEIIETKRKLLKEELLKKYGSLIPTFESSDISTNKLKRIAKKPLKKWDGEKAPYILCSSCANPVGQKCTHKLCKKCCKILCFSGKIDCIGHRFNFSKGYLST